MAETNDVIIKKVANEPGAITGSQWWSMKKSNMDGQLATKSEDRDYLAQLFYRLISQMSKSKQSVTVQAAYNETDSDARQRESEQSVGAMPKIVTVKMQGGLSSIPLSDSEMKEIDVAFKKLTKVLQSDTPEDLRQLLEDLTMLNMVDVGGQQAFLELCPVFITGPALYLIFFRLDQELRKNYQVKFQAADKDETILETSYSTETVVHQTLTSIATFECHTKADSEPTKCPPVSGRALLFGTYKDKVDDERIRKVNKELKQQLVHTKLYKEDLLLGVTKDELFYSLNNKTGDDSEISPIRKDIERIIKRFFTTVPVPASWLMFRIILHFLHKPVVSLAECEMIASHLLMTTPVQRAIQFFHHNIGSLMHYPEIPSMKDIVICDTQIVFDSVSELIIDTFKISNREIPQSAVEDFYEKGQFSLAHIKVKTEHHRNNQLTPDQLVDLLKYRNILAEIKPNQESSTPSTHSEPKFVMPAILKNASDEELKEISSTNFIQEAFPLIIYFQSGFVPFGVFCACIAKLIACQDSMSPPWQLCKDQMKNKVKFCIDKSFFATLISRPQYLEIRVERHRRARSKCLPNKVCPIVRQTVVKTLEAVISTMKYRSYSSMWSPLLSTEQTFELAFTCCLDDSHSVHLMKVGRDEKGICGECLNDVVTFDLEEKHLIWFDEVST